MITTGELVGRPICVPDLNLWSLSSGQRPKVQFEPRAKSSLEENVKEQQILKLKSH